MTQVQKEQITIMRARGMKYRDIAVVLGIPENTVKSYCTRNGVTVGSGSDQVNCCIQCGKMLTGKETKYCSNSCNLKHWRMTHPTSSGSTIYSGICAECGEQFNTMGNKHQKYCSKACAGLARRKAGEVNE